MFILHYYPGFAREIYASLSRAQPSVIGYNNKVLPKFADLLAQMIACITRKMLLLFVVACVRWNWSGSLLVRLYLTPLGMVVRDGN